MGWDGHHLNLILYSTLFIEDSLSETHWSMNDRWKPGRKEKGFMQNISQVSPTPVLTRVPDTWHVTRDTWLRQFSLSDRFSRLMTCCRGGQTSLIRFHHLPTSTFVDVIFMKSLVFQTWHEVCIILLSRILSSQYCVKLNYGAGTHFVKLPSIL